MKFLNFVGSSHLSVKHGLPKTLQRHFSQMDGIFKSNYCMREIQSCPGATYCCDQFLNSFFKLASDQVHEKDYSGQVNVVVLGSNDYRDISNLPAALIEAALKKFEFKMSNFLERLLSVEDSTVIVLSLIMPRHLMSVDLNWIVEQFIRYIVYCHLLNVQF